MLRVEASLTDAILHENLQKLMELTHNMLHESDAAYIVASLQELGYICRWFRAPAEHHGSPIVRVRIFLIGLCVKEGVDAAWRLD